MGLDAMPRREEGGKQERRKIQKHRVATHYCWPLPLSHPSVFPASPILSTVSQPLALLLASSSLSPSGFTPVTGSALDAGTKH